MCCEIFWGAQIAALFLARGADPREDCPKDGSIPFCAKESYRGQSWNLKHDSSVATGLFSLNQKFADSVAPISLVIVMRGPV